MSGRRPFAGPLALALAALAATAALGAFAPGPRAAATAMASSGGAAVSERSPVARVEINIPAFRLTVYSGPRAVASYPVAVGARSRTVGTRTKTTETPLGRFTIGKKRKDPAWYPPAWVVRENGWDSGYAMPPGPDNPLGVRWMALSRPGYVGYGIHGTADAGSIGRAVSLGCVRMYNDDVVKLFDQVPSGTPVDIVYRTAEVVRDGDGRVYLALYPDVYRRGAPTAASVRDELTAAGLDGASAGDDVWKKAVAMAKDRAVLVPLPEATASGDAPDALSAASPESLPVVEPARFKVMEIPSSHPDVVTVYLEGRALGTATRSGDDWLLPLTRLPGGFQDKFALDPVTGGVLFYGVPLPGATVSDGVIQVPVLAMTRSVGMGAGWTAPDRLNLSW